MENLSNKIELNKALVDEFVGFQKHIRENTIAMAQKAYELRSQYLQTDGKKYDKEFETWWSDYKLDTIFGKRANFTKWASAGAALAQAEIGKYRDQLPTTLTALYEVSQLTPQELKLCIEDRFTRASLADEPKGRKKPSPLIHPETTAAEIKGWRERWRNPKSKSTEKRRLPYATVKVHGSLYDFDDKGLHKGVLTIDTLKEIHDALTTSMQPFAEYVLVEAKLDELVAGHHKRQQQAQERARKDAAKKNVTKKTK